jgi:hypothetical protein
MHALRHAQLGALTAFYRLQYRNPGTRSALVRPRSARIQVWSARPLGTFLAILEVGLDPLVSTPPVRQSAGGAGRVEPRLFRIARGGGEMTQFFSGVYGVFCAVGYMAVRILLAIVLVFLFVTAVGVVAKFVEKHLIGARG